MHKTTDEPATNIMKDAPQEVDAYWENFHNWLQSEYTPQPSQHADPQPLPSCQPPRSQHIFPHRSPIYKHPHSRQCQHSLQRCKEG